MNILHLLWIVPLVGSLGFLFCSMLVVGSDPSSTIRRAEEEKKYD